MTQNQYPVLTSSQQQGIVLQEDYFADRQVTTDNNVGYYVLPKGYFTYRSRSDTDVFVFNRNNIVDKGIISYYYPVFAPKSCDSNFLLRRLNHGIKKQLSMAAEGTGQKVLAHAKFKNMVVDVPSQSEQEKIGTILEELDTLITLHQRKYERLVNIKKSMLDKMFPQNGASVPEIRFKGFTDPWEQRKLGDISEIKTGPFGSTLHADDYVSDGIPIITTEHFKTGSLPIDKCGLPQVSENDFSRLSAYILNAGDIVFSRVGSVDINALITPFQSTWLFSGRVLRVRPQNKNSSQFLHTLLETEDVKNDIRTRAVGQTMPSINTEILKTTPLRLPESTLEQEQLGKYFLNLDTLITLHQRKLEKLQNIKKSCLEKMFV